MSKGSRYIRDLFNLSVGVVLLVLIYSCANIGSPNGGPYDEAPPKFVSSTPIPNQVNYKGKSVEILFDELIQIEIGTKILPAKWVRNGLHGVPDFYGAIVWIGEPVKEIVF